MKRELSPGELKQEIIKIYNTINQEIFGVGIKSQKIDVVGDKVLIFATHKRIPALKVLDGEHRSITASVDMLIMEVNKKRLKEELERSLGLDIVAVLKDYDPEAEISGTIIIFKHKLAP
ncbi:Na-translocating system protein MpsC family protein [Paenibacillus thailandensis]|uniref:Na-translocating system protein MpsC family protein n=1 Tax=Paenibacillus thailandensis TaxID=393250 RepID=A0ABW5R4B2_9BACL